MKKIIISIVALALVVFALIGITAMSNESSQKHWHRVIRASQVQHGRHYFNLVGINSRVWVRGSGVRRTSKRICFKTGFENRPTVTLGYYLVDMLNNANFRADTYVSRVTTKCFTLVFKTWADSHPWAIGVTWTARASIF